MDLLEALEARHSVRSYTDKPLPQDVRDTLNAVLAECNHEGALLMQMICDEPGAFGGLWPKYAARWISGTPLFSHSVLSVARHT